MADRPFPGDRRRDTSMELTEVRTVHSRARTALNTVRRRPEYLREGREKYPDSPYYKRSQPDPDNAEMVKALEQVVALLERWSR